MEPLHKKQYSFPFSTTIERAFEAFGIHMKIVVIALIAIFISSCLFLLYKVSSAYMVAVPRHGGTLNEGIVGLPQYINPLLSVTGAGQDLTQLIYSGLVKKTISGEYEGDLARTYTVSPDLKTYTFVINEEATFHDGAPVTADDVIFTISRALDPNLKSPKRANWEGITLQKLNDSTVQFVLKQPYPFFLENATVGILPKHIWNEVSNEEFAFSNYNRNPIGSGAYEVDAIHTNSGGIPLSYQLKAFKKYTGGTPFISTINIKFYSTETALLEAYESGSVDSINSISPLEASRVTGEGARIEQTVLPRIFGVFFNTSKNPVLEQKEVRQALSLATNKDAIIKSVLSGYGETIDSPLPKQFLHEQAVASTLSAKADTSYEERLVDAVTLLESKNWEKNADGIFEKTIGSEVLPLSITISTSDVPELKAVAEMLRADWQKIGAVVSVKIFETSDLNSNVIRTRNYEALLFGQVITRDTDLYAFWHSSERNDPGLNIANYSNGSVDTLLEDARTLPAEERSLKYTKVLEHIKADIPALFLYAPEFLYVIPKDLEGVKLPPIADPKDRFIGIAKWYRETDNVWELFAQ